jgi:7,8-dihydropterin-6-yl-methyl-4-(beta-D-ribofuranosyl)aminobenzene 5'-phosphate synthase
MKITLLYDNETHQADLASDRGFSCIIEVNGNPPLLFDTGARGAILLKNMRTSGITPSSIKEVFLSHNHSDHTGGLPDLLKEKSDITVFVPPDYVLPQDVKKVVKLESTAPLNEDVYATGWMNGIEQSLFVKSDRGIVVIVGCSHAGLKDVLDLAYQYGDVYGIVGGLHGFNEFGLLKDINLVCGCHCTNHKYEIKTLYPEKWIDGGAGRVITL